MKFDILKFQNVKSAPKSTIFEKRDFWVLIYSMSFPNLSLKNILFFKIPYLYQEFWTICISFMRPRDLENFILGDFDTFEDF